MAAALGLATPAWSAPAEGLRPPHLRPDPTTTEAGLWAQFDKAEAHVRGSADLDPDPALTAYVRGVICKLAAEYCDELRIYVVDRPVLNAAAAPNGYIEVNSGLLLRAQSEDELAFVLGHEVSHFGRNHSVARWNTMKTNANVALVLSIGVGVVAAGAMYSAASSGSVNSSNTINSISQAAQSVNDLIYLAAVAAVFSYSREQESEADSLGFGRAKSAGYQAGQSVDMWQDVLTETQASDFPKVRKSDSRASMFASHPLTAERMTVLKTLAGDTPLQPDMEARRAYRGHIRPHLAEWLRDDLRRRDFGQTIHLIDRLETLGEDMGVLEFYRGEALRQRRGDGDPPLAFKAYKASTDHADTPPAAWRELGEAQRKAGDTAAARAAFQTYLDRAGDAQDRWLVEASLKSMQPTGTP
jgi:predicted Zn-dependent protease